MRTGQVSVSHILFLAILVLIVLPFPSFYLVFGQSGYQRGMHGDLEAYYTMKSILSTLNAGLLLILLAVYVGAYRETRSEFLVGLIIFDVAMLFYALTSSPFLYGHFGFRASGLGPFAMLPDLFSLVAVTVLLVQAVRYR